ncbi:hypothetical protein [Limnobaculum xujianqingii]|uniref:hypothetical protein n=1 Tax=Limnobaculum xujianqingii TaxID=2738837 RepID=UPI00112AA8CB|nr:hypothetical protein [Limnobaculum xujianqingii]
MTENKKTESGRLKNDILYNDTLHYEFEIRLPVMRDTSSALEQTEEAYGQIEGYTANTFYRQAVLSSAIVSLGDIPKDDITPVLFMEELTEDDYDEFQSAIARLKVKRNGGNPASPDSV